jgi:SAM-dependent methyltransferase
MTAPLAIVRDPVPLRVLHLGVGRKGQEVPYVTEPIATVITLDADPFLKPDLVCRLGAEPIPLSDNSVDVAVAVHVLEHIGQQGETAEWFQFWEELYRVLVPDGELRFESPLYDSVWCWADPSHVRALSPQALLYFSQDSYRVPTAAISPYRLECNFLPTEKFRGLRDSNAEIAAVEQVSHFRGTLRAVKPLVRWWEDR